VFIRHNISAMITRESLSKGSYDNPWGQIADAIIRREELEKRQKLLPRVHRWEVGSVTAMITSLTASGIGLSHQSTELLVGGLIGLLVSSLVGATVLDLGNDILRESQRLER